MQNVEENILKKHLETEKSHCETLAIKLFKRMSSPRVGEVILRDHPAFIVCFNSEKYQIPMWLIVTSSISTIDNPQKFSRPLDHTEFNPFLLLVF